MNTITTGRQQANNFASAGDSLTSSLLNSAGQTGVNYVAPPGGALGSLAQAVLESDALRRYKNSKTAKLAGMSTADPQARAQVAVNKAIKSKKLPALNIGSNGMVAGGV